MSRHDDPFTVLPFAVAGVIVGVGLSGLCGYLALDRWATPPVASRHEQAVIEGPIEWAGWRQSAHAEGPVWFLQLRLATDSRGFLVATSDLTDALRERLRQEQPLQNGARLSSLIGIQATIGVAPRFQKRPRSPTPYARTLWIDGTAVVAPGSPSAEADGPYAWIASGLVGVGLLVGFGVASVSAHHLVVCARHWSAGV